MTDQARATRENIGKRVAGMSEPTDAWVEAFVEGAQEVFGEVDGKL
jgi:hypothetical protein